MNRNVGYSNILFQQYKRYCSLFLAHIISKKLLFYVAAAVILSTIFKLTQCVWTLVCLI